MISREKRETLLCIFLNAKREDELDKVIDKGIIRLADKVRGIFGEQGKELDKHLPEEITKESINPALDKVFKATSQKFMDTILSETLPLSKEATNSLAEQYKGTVGLSFDTEAPLQTKFLKDRAAAMVTGIDETTRQDIHDIVTRGHEEHKSYSQVAKEIRDKYSEMAAPKPQGHIQDRATLIAVTELAMASQSTSYAHNLELVKKGWLVDKFWSNTGDAKVSKGCLTNSAQGWIQLEQPFTSGHLHPPRFPGCRCAVSFKILGKDPNFKKDVETKKNNEEIHVQQYDIPSTVYDIGDRDHLAEILHDTKYSLRSDLSKEEKASITHYQNEGYRQINSLLRGNLKENLNSKELDEVYQHIANINSAQEKMGSITKENNIHFFGLGVEKANDIIQDGKYFEPAYRSSSLDLSTAYGFAARERDEFGFCNVFVFQTPKGTHALSLGDGEYEYLMPKGEQYVVTHIFNIDRLEYNHRDNGIQRGTPFEKVRMILLKRVIR